MDSKSKTLGELQRASLKKSLRAQAVGRLKLLGLAQSPDHQQRLAEMIRRFLGRRQGIWGSYMPLSYEANPQVEGTSVSWVYPKIEMAHLDFYSTTEFTPGPFSVPAPVTALPPVPLHDIEGILIPGLAFDHSGVRLGHGKGYFDRTLKSYQGLKVGVAFQAQMADELPRDPWDMTVDYIITEQTIIKVSKDDRDHSAPHGRKATATRSREGN